MLRSLSENKQEPVLQAQLVHIIYKITPTLQGYLLISQFLNGSRMLVVVQQQLMSLEIQNILLRLEVRFSSELIIISSMRLGC